MLHSAVTQPYRNATERNGASIVICCYNSATRISATLKHLAGQITSMPWEVLVVDNACTDDTVKVAKSTWNHYESPTELRIIHEPTPGVAIARHTGIVAARFEYVIFCDDDNWLDENYIERAVELMKTHPDVGIAIGLSEPVTDVNLPGWFWTFSRGYAIGALALESGYVTNHRFAWTAGMTLRRSVYLEIRAAGADGLLIGRKAGQLSAGEDNELCMWFILAGYRLWYEEALQFRHYIPKERLTKEYCRRLRAGSDEAGKVLARYSAVIRSFETPQFGKRAVIFIAAAARAFLGNPYGRFTAQAFSPIPFFMFDATTRGICHLAKRIRKRFADLPQENGSLNTTVCIRTQCACVDSKLTCVK
jgi:glycosyltransferase involved in cell wall biosynthesis